MILTKTLLNDLHFSGFQYPSGSLGVMIGTKDTPLTTDQIVLLRDEVEKAVRDYVNEKKPSETHKKLVDALNLEIKKAKDYIANSRAFGQGTANAELVVEVLERIQSVIKTEKLCESCKEPMKLKANEYECVNPTCLKSKVFTENKLIDRSLLLD